MNLLFILMHCKDMHNSKEKRTVVVMKLLSEANQSSPVRTKILSFGLWCLQVRCGKF